MTKNHFLPISFLVVIALAACQEAKKIPRLSGKWSITEGDSSGSLYLIPAFAGLSESLPGYEFSCHVKSQGYDFQLNESGDYTYEVSSEMKDKGGDVYGLVGTIYFNPSSGSPWSSEYQLNTEGDDDLLWLDLPVNGVIVAEFQR